LKPFFDDVRTVDLRKSKDEVLTTVENIMKVFKRYHAWLMDDIIIQNIPLNRDGSFNFDDVAQMAALVNAIPKDYVEFMKAFLSTQQFSVYGAKLLEIINKKKVPQIQKKMTHKHSFSVG
jgi:hypothetical protein